MRDRVLWVITIIVLLASCSTPYRSTSASVRFHLERVDGSPLAGAKVIVDSIHPCRRTWVSHTAERGEDFFSVTGTEEITTNSAGSFEYQVPAESGYCGFPRSSPKHWFMVRDKDDASALEAVVIVLASDDLFPAVFEVVLPSSGDPLVHAPATTPGLGNPFQQVSFEVSREGRSHERRWVVRARRLVA